MKNTLVVAAVSCVLLLVAGVAWSQSFSVDNDGNVEATSFKGDGSGLTGVGPPDVLDDTDTVVGEFLAPAQVIIIGPGSIEYYLGVSTAGLSSSFNVDVHFTSNGCAGSAFTTNTSSVTLNNLRRPGILMGGAGPNSGLVYAAAPGVAVTSFNNASFIDRSTGNCEDVNPDVPGTNGRAVSLLDDISGFTPPMKLGN